MSNIRSFISSWLKPGKYSVCSTQCVSFFYDICLCYNVIVNIRIFSIKWNVMIEVTVSSAANVLYVPTNYPITLLTEGQYKLQFLVVTIFESFTQFQESVAQLINKSRLINDDRQQVRSGTPG